MASLANVGLSQSPKWKWTLSNRQLYILWRWSRGHRLTRSTLMLAILIVVVAILGLIDLTKSGTVFRL
jgi:hypothetical protein